MDPRTFLTALWGESPPGPILIWMLPQKRSQWYHSFDHISEDLAAYPDRDLYTGVGFPAPGTNDLIKFKRGQASDIGGLAGMWADIDVAHPIHKKTEPHSHHRQRPGNTGPAALQADHHHSLGPRTAGMVAL